MQKKLYIFIIMSKNLRPCSSITTIIILFLSVAQIYSLCVAPLGNCNTCAHLFACAVCAPNFCLSSGGCPSCGSKIPNCISCSSCTNCLVCQSTYVLNAGKCQLCSVTLPRCATCPSTTSCATCTAPNQMIGTDCCSTAMPFCTGCKSNPSQCDNCISTLYCKQTPALCVTCSTPMPNCVTCSSCTACTSCVSNLYAINSSTKCQLCSELMPKCVTCSAAAACTLCTAPDYGITSGSQCGRCPEISPHCTTCTSYNYCTACESTLYAISPAHLCQSCSTLIPHCIHCSSATVCMQCDPSYTVNPAFQCQLCTVTMANCAICSAINVCNICYAGFHLVGFQTCCNVPMPYCLSCKNDPNLCDACISDSYYMATPVICSLCKNAIPFCARCTPNGTLCIECFAGFIFDSQFHCQKCGDFVDNCGFCNNTPACTGCITTDYLLVDPLHCDLCIVHLNDCQTCLTTTECSSCLNDTMAINPTYKCGFCNVSLANCTNCYNYTACKTCIVDPDVILTVNLECKTCADLVPQCLKCQSQFSCQLDYCARSFGIKYINGHKKCIRCSQMMTGCSTCRNDMQCTRCSIGEIVEGGCSQVIGCLRVDPSKPKSPCVRCDMSEFNNDPVNSTCKCLFGWKIAGLHCTNITGCTRVEKIGTNLICVLCDRNNKFLPRNGTCVCQKYYEPKGQTCVQICGDGKRINSECDDGNKMSGDGCSATCKVEYKYLCSDDLIGRSHCVYDGTIRLFYFCTYKLLIPNSIEVVFNFKPYISNLQKSKLNNLFISPNGAITINEVYVKDKQLRINITYSQSLQGKRGSLKFVFDSYYIKSRVATVTFPFKECNGKPLDFENVQTPFKGIMKEVSKYMNIVAFCNLLLGSFATRMIGVETINAIQLIAMSQAFAPKYYPTIEGMNGFTSSIGGFQNVITNSTIVMDPVQFQRLNYSSDFIGNTLVIIIFQFSSIGLYALLMVTQKLKLFEKIKVKYCMHKKIEEYKEFIYRFLVFPSYAGFIFNIFFANFVLTYKMVDKTQITQIRQNSILSLLTTIIFTLVVNYQWKHLFIANKDEQQKLQKPYYIGVYLAYTFIINVIAELCVLGFIEYKVYVMGGLVSLYLILLVIYRPYNSVLHNFVLIVNQIGVVSAFVWLFLQETLVFTRDIEQILGYSLAGYISLISLLAIIRSIIQIKKRYFSGTYQNGEADNQLDDSDQQKRVKDDVDDYLRKYYRKNVDEKVQKLTMQNKILQQYTGNERQTDYQIDTHSVSMNQPPKYRLRQILQSQREKSTLKNPLREKKR